MDLEQLYRKWLVNWQPKHANVNFKKNSWQETTLLAYMNVIKNVVNDLKIEDPSIKQNLFDYSDPKKYTIAYHKIINHSNFKSLQYYPLAKKSLKRYLDFLYDLK
ncbi:hypothetical protein [Mariniplasma anaerobium]|uniref:Uncharacterized protein n=1 Tax=Mariniplasma anaerobium TaxID=2735436 RepID=A0A7U9THB4_9MOLU|nr:hypothetical protein [Mariniplasma anaerobium]BCR35247.1 hypothetical protein MPAN_001400 [Mariniplasma anaerobium]